MVTGKTILTDTQRVLPQSSYQFSGTSSNIYCPYHQLNGIKYANAMASVAQMKYKSSQHFLYCRKKIIFGQTMFSATLKNSFFTVILYNKLRCENCNLPKCYSIYAWGYNEWGLQQCDDDYLPRHDPKQGYDIFT